MILRIEIIKNKKNPIAAKQNIPSIGKRKITPKICSTTRNKEKAKLNIDGTILIVQQMQNISKRIENKVDIVFPPRLKLH